MDDGALDSNSAAEQFLNKAQTRSEEKDARVNSYSSAVQLVSDEQTRLDVKEGATDWYSNDELQFRIGVQMRSEVDVAGDV